MTVQAGGGITLNGGASANAGSAIGASNASASAQTADITITAAGNIRLNGNNTADPGETGIFLNFNLNLPLLKQLAERAPGTYHHSIMVGVLAEAGAEAVGGDALFARVACYYHDIGKSVRPYYFIENQSYMDNRHDKLSPKMSSIVLANHVKQGVEIAKEHKLPPRIIDIIPQHHGTGLMKFFYYKARRDSEDESMALENEFRYPGPKP